MKDNRIVRCLGEGGAFQLRERLNLDAKQEHGLQGGWELVCLAFCRQFLHSKELNVWTLLRGLLTAVRLWCCSPSGRGPLGPINILLSLSGQSKNSDTEYRTLAAPGAIVSKQNFTGFQPLQQVAESVGGNTDILFREACVCGGGGFRVLCGK